jgi:hypothetical protein
MTLLFSLCQFLSMLCNNQSCWHFGKDQRFPDDNFICHGAGDISGITTKINDRGGQANFFSKTANRKSAIFGLIPQSQIRKFLRCASWHIANLQIFMINSQIRTFLRNSAQLCLKTVLKVVFLNGFYCV